MNLVFLLLFKQRNVDFYAFYSSGLFLDIIFGYLVAQASNSCKCFWTVPHPFMLLVLFAAKIWQRTKYKTPFSLIYHFSWKGTINKINSQKYRMWDDSTTGLSKIVKRNSVCLRRRWGRVCHFKYDSQEDLMEKTCV